MTPQLLSSSLMVAGASVLIFGMVTGTAVSTNAAALQVRDAASTEGLLVLAQTPGMERREERRATRQNCRQQNGLIGAAKRACKQNARGQ
jgi:hypothetical protein